MALYTISDLHLPLGVDKPMNIFGSAWENYVERLRDNWQSVVSDEDTVALGSIEERQQAPQLRHEAFSVQRGTPPIRTVTICHR